MDDFIGSTFPTPKGGTLTITGVSPRVRLSSGRLPTKTYTAVCSICNKDEELHGKVFNVLKSSVSRREESPCGCSYNHRYTENQWTIKATRLALKMGYIFKGFLGWSGTKTRVKLYCPSHGEWSTTPLGALSRGVGCTGCGIDQNAVVRRLDLDKARTNYPNNITISQDTLKPYPNYLLSCSICSADEYALAGLCSGTFPLGRDNLSKGHLSCRCNTQYRYTCAQREYKLRQQIHLLGGTLLGFKGNPAAVTSSLVSWLCPEGHYNSTIDQNVKAKGFRCRTCAENQFGLYKHKVDYEDNLYLLRFYNDKEEFIKIGRTFELEVRYGQFRKHYNVEELNLNQGLHKEIREMEIYFHDSLRALGLAYKPVIPFGGSVRECFTMEALNHINLQ